MADQIYEDGPVDAPAKYTVPGSAVIIPIAVQALLNGSGASGDFVPTLIFRSQAGHVIARVPTETTVAAGGSAEVSWFPGVKRSPTSSSGGGTWHYCRVVCGPTTPGGSIAGGFGTTMSIASFATDDPTNYVQVDATHWSIPQVPQLVCGYVTPDGGAVTTLNADVYIVALSGGSVPVGVYGQNTLKMLVSWYSYGLTRAIELQNNWHAEAMGGGTRQFDLVVTYAAVY